MTNDSDYQQQVSEIHEVIAEARSGIAGGGFVTLVWCALTAAAVLLSVFGLVRGVAGHNAMWVTHNGVGWAITLLWFQRESRREGRVSLRGRLILRTWAMITLAIWLCVGVSGRLAGTDGNAILTALLPLLAGIGIFSTGTLCENNFSQGLGVALALVGVGLALFAPQGIAGLLVMLSLIVGVLVWGLASWRATEGR